MDDKTPNTPTVTPEKPTEISEGDMETDEIEIMLSKRRDELKSETPPPAPPEPEQKKKSLFAPTKIKPKTVKPKRTKPKPFDDIDDEDDEEYQIDINQTGRFPVIPILITAAATILVIVIAIIVLLNQSESAPEEEKQEDTTAEGMSLNEQYGVPEWIEVDLLTINENSRPGTPLDAVNGAVVHYVANAGTTAKQNRAYFENLANSETYASANFIIDTSGAVLLLVPTNEVAYCSNERNFDTLSIECCHPDETGEFTEATYASLIRLLAWLSAEFDFPTEDIIRHYDITGKACPVYYVDNPDKWAALIADVKNAE
jgi:N-acetylmuramoyl-L-alanine amidase